MRHGLLAAVTLLTASVAAAPLVAGAQAAKHQLTLWEEEQPDIQAALDEAIERFHKAQPEIRVKRSHYKTEDLRVQFQTAGMAGAGADLLLAPNDFAGVMGTMGIIHPVQEWARMARFHPSSVAAITDPKGVSWGVPINRGNHLILFVNKALAKKAPATIEDLVQIAKPLTDRGARRYGLAYNALEPFWFTPFMGAFGGWPLVGQKPAIGDAATTKALALVRDLKDKDAVTPLSCDYACAETLFVEKKAAMTINGDWAIRQYAAALGDDLIVAPLPTLAATGQPMTPMVSGKYLMPNAKLKGDKLEAAKTFIEFMVSSETQLFLATRTKRLPSLVGLDQNAAIKDDPLLAASLAALANAKPMPMEVEMRAVWDAIRPQLGAVMAGRAKPEDAVKVMQADAERKVAEMR